MISRPTITACVASCDEADLLAECLSSLLELDEVIVFDLQSSDSTRALAEAQHVRVVSLPRPAFIELIRQEQLDASASEWVLFVDPDERLPNGWVEATRRVLESMAPSESGLWLAYREVAFGRPLQVTRFGAAKIALVRRDAARGLPKERAKPHAPLLIEGQVLQVNASIPLISHVGFTSVSSAISKLSRYAENDGIGAVAAEGFGPLTCIKMLWGSVVMTGAYRDGSAGVAVASLSAIGDYLGLLQRWDRQGRPKQRDSKVETALITVARTGHRAQWSLRRKVRWWIA